MKEVSELLKERILRANKEESEDAYMESLLDWDVALLDGGED